MREEGAEMSEFVDADGVITVATTGRDLAAFKPAATKTRQDVLKAAANYAVRLRDWDAVEQAVSQQVDEQADFVAWWDANVGKNHGGDRSKSAGRGTCSMADAEAQTGISNQQVSRWRKATEAKNRDKYVAQLVAAAKKKAMIVTADNHRAQGTGENEWYTPAADIALAKNVLGTIDLDPASSPMANVKVGAKRIYTQADNGLSKPWHGKVWLNPPYAQPEIQHFIEKAVAEYESGHVSEAVVLTHNYTDTAWFQAAANGCAAICFTRGRIAFESPTGEKAAPTQGQAFFYFGTSPEKFAEVFASRGMVVLPCR